MTHDKPRLEPISIILLSEALIVLPIVLSLTAPYRLLAILIHAFVCVWVLQFSLGGSLGEDFNNAATFSNYLFTAVHLLWMTNPFEDFRYVGVGNGDGEIEPDIRPAELPFWKRVWWAMSVNHSVRGVGWNYEVSHVPKRPTSTRWVFVGQSLLRLFKYYLIIDFAQWVHVHPHLGQCTLQSLSFTSTTFQMCYINMVCLLFMIVCAVSAQYTLLAIICVAFGWWEPAAWPPVFGNWSDAYSIKRFWGRSWHQLMRRFLTSIGKGISSLLSLSPGSKASYFTQLFVAFFITGIIHTFGDAMVSPTLVGSTFIFFILQPIGIVLEEVFQGLTANILPNHTTFRRIVGYLWFCFWLSAFTPGMIRWCLVVKVTENGQLPFSFIRQIAPM